MPTATEYPLPAGSAPSSVARDPNDGSLWFGCESLNALVHVHLDGTYDPPVPLPLANAGCGGIAFGPDGFGRVTMTKLNKVAVFDATTQAFTGWVYAIPIGTAPGGILYQPADGYCYVFCTGNGRIARLDTSGNWAATWAVPSGSGCYPHGPCLDAQGRVAFCEINAGKAAWVDTTGTFTEVALAGSQPAVCAAGGDGALYCTDERGRLWRIDQTATPPTAASYSNPPASNATPFGLCADANGNLVYTDRATGQVGVLPSGGGAATECACPSGPTCQPNKLVLAGDGAVWGGERAAAKVFRFA